MSHRHFLFVTASARPGGNSVTLARVAAAALPPDTVQDWRDLPASALPDFHDLRHSGGYDAPRGQAADLALATMNATDIVFVAPLYWYSLPAPAKLYLDHWSHWQRFPALGFRAAMAEKSLWLIMAHASSTPDEIAPAITPLRLTAAYMGMVWAGALLGDANTPGSVFQDQRAMGQAANFFLP